MAQEVIPDTKLHNHVTKRPNTLKLEHGYRGSYGLMLTLVNIQRRYKKTDPAAKKQERI